VSEVEGIDDGPFLLELEIVVVEKAQDLLDLHAVRNKKEQCPIVVKVALTEANSELYKVLHLLIPTWNVLWEF
jgi:hypothetical protein